jgi:hypothetical protein
MRRPEPAKLSNNANFYHTPSTNKAWQVSMLRRRETQAPGTNRMRSFLH